MSAKTKCGCGEECDLDLEAGMALAQELSSALFGEIEKFVKKRYPEHSAAMVRTSVLVSLDHVLGGTSYAMWGDPKAHSRNIELVYSVASMGMSGAPKLPQELCDELREIAEKTDNGGLPDHGAN